MHKPWMMAARVLLVLAVYGAFSGGVLLLVLLLYYGALFGGRYRRLFLAGEDALPSLVGGFVSYAWLIGLVCAVIGIAGGAVVLIARRQHGESLRTAWLAVLFGIAGVLLPMLCALVLLITFSGCQ